MALLSGLDVLVLDALRPQAARDALQPRRSDRSRPGAWAAADVFTHMSHDLEHEATNAALPPGMELAYDGQRIPN